ncbi:MAG: gfo/Idh/MocA family oxidoreductase, partial [Bacteroidales bacterium]|nr:gfo/Idh/MocA family oxidoreductase [Bacteroidales bacterium]
MSQRRTFLKQSAMLAAGSLLAPVIVPASVFGKNAPSNRITVACIGLGRQMVNPNIPQLLKSPHAQIVAVCDVDSWRLE